jgi:hypothetical protein
MSMGLSPKEEKYIKIIIIINLFFCFFGFPLGHRRPRGVPLGRLYPGRKLRKKKTILLFIFVGRRRPCGALQGHLLPGRKPILLFYYYFIILLLFFLPP